MQSHLKHASKVKRDNGSLCVMDRLPRRLRERQREALVTLSRCAINELEASRRHSERLDQAVSSAMTPFGSMSQAIMWP